MLVTYVFSITLELPSPKVGTKTSQQHTHTHPYLQTSIPQPFLHPCIHACLHACMHIHTFIHTYITLHYITYIQTDTHTYIHTHTDIQTYIQTYIHTCVMCTCVHVYMCMCTCTYIHTNTSRYIAYIYMYMCVFMCELFQNKRFKKQSKIIKKSFKNCFKINRKMSFFKKNYCRLIFPPKIKNQSEIDFVTKSNRSIDFFTRGAFGVFCNEWLCLCA